MYYDCDVDLDRIRFVYELRHSLNVLGSKIVAERLRTSAKRLMIIYESGIHGSKRLSPLLVKSKQKFREILNGHLNNEQERENKILEAEYKNDNLIAILSDKRKSFANIGTNKAKRRLNKLSKTNKIAAAIRLALEIEDKNINAKKTYGKYRDKIYNQKYIFILKLVDLFKEMKWNYGVSESDNFSMSYVIFFEIPDCEQISWHFNPGNKNEFPNYDKEWDKKENSTLLKLEEVSVKLLEENNLLI